MEMQIREYQKQDFLEGTEPYEVLYKYIDNQFLLSQMTEQMADVAKKAGGKGFKNLFRKRILREISFRTQRILTDSR